MNNIIVDIMIYVVMGAFWLMILYYTVLFVAGVNYRLSEQNKIKNRNLDLNILREYPSVSIFVPAYNEGVVLADTLYHMSKLRYDGDLQIYVLDDSSTDNTRQIAEFYASSLKNFHYVSVPEGFPKGKSRVLNYGVKLSKSKYIAIYDADNQPEPYALKLLVEAAEQTPKSCGAVGYVKTLNFYRNSLTRMIGLEFSIFQNIMQCGRWRLSKLGTYSGTNMIVKREALEQVGYWDENAIAEDFELTVRLSTLDYVCPVVPESRTWEQEPEKFTAWFRQRSRWMLGNIYIIDKAFKTPSWLKKKALRYTLQIVSVYFIFIFLLLVSHGIWMFGVTGLDVYSNIAVPSMYAWFFSWLMYLTYAQFWIVLAVKAIIVHIIGKFKKSEKGPVWDKTNRF